MATTCSHRAPSVLKPPLQRSRPTCLPSKALGRPAACHPAVATHARAAAVRWPRHAAAAAVSEAWSSDDEPEPLPPPPQQGAPPLRQQLLQPQRWPHTARVALRTGLYILLAGIVLLAFPRSLFLLGFQPSRVAPGWVRVGGVLASLFGAYYCGAAMDDAEGRYPLHLYRATVAGRLALSATFCLFVALGEAEPPLLWLAIANAISSWALQRALAARCAVAAKKSRAS